MTSSPESQARAKGVDSAIYPFTSRYMIYRGEANKLALVLGEQAMDIVRFCASDPWIVNGGFFTWRIYSVDFELGHVILSRQGLRQSIADHYWRIVRRAALPFWFTHVLPTAQKHPSEARADLSKGAYDFH